MKKTTNVLAILLILPLVLMACTSQNDNTPAENDNNDDNYTMADPTFVCLNAFYDFVAGRRVFEPHEMWYYHYRDLSPNFVFNAPLIRFEDILPDAVENFSAVEVGRTWYMYFLQCETRILVQYSPDSSFSTGLEFEPTVGGMAFTSFSLNDGNIRIIIRKPNVPERIPSWLEYVAPDRVEAMIQAQEAYHIVAQEQVTAIFTDPAYLPITAVFMFDQAWVESAVETLDFMTEELATQLQAEISEAARTNVPSPADTLMENIRANMVWPR